MNRSGKQIAQENVLKFLAWVAERDTSADWSEYVHQGKLKRSEIASECGFALSVVRQNPAVKSALNALEVRLVDTGIIQPGKVIPRSSVDVTTNAACPAIDKHMMVARGKAEQRVKQLEEQNAALRAEVRELRERIKTYRHLDEHLCSTGRLLHA